MVCQKKQQKLQSAAPIIVRISKKKYYVNKNTYSPRPKSPQFVKNSSSLHFFRSWFFVVFVATTYLEAFFTKNAFKTTFVICDMCLIKGQGSCRMYVCLVESDVTLGENILYHDYLLLLTITNNYFIIRLIIDFCCFWFNFFNENKNKF